MPDPFISTQDVVDYLGRGTATDPGLVIVTDAACDVVRTLCERSFNAGTSTVTLDGSGTDALLIPNKYLPLGTVGTITVNGGTTDTAYVANDNGILYRGSAGADPRSVWPSGRQNITLTFTHGYAEVDLPRDVRMLALGIAERLAVQGAAVEESVGAVRIKYAGPAMDLSTTEQIIVHKYRGIR